VRKSYLNANARPDFSLRFRHMREPLAKNWVAEQISDGDLGFGPPAR